MLAKIHDNVTQEATGKTITANWILFYADVLRFTVKQLTKPKVIPPWSGCRKYIRRANPTKQSRIYVLPNWKNRRERKRSWII